MMPPCFPVCSRIPRQKEGEIAMKIKQVLSSIGALVGVYGIASIVLYVLGYPMRLLVWVDQWGLYTGWLIRIALVIAGTVLYIYGRNPE